MRNYKPIAAILGLLCLPPFAGYGQVTTASAVQAPWIIGFCEFRLDGVPEELERAASAFPFLVMRLLPPMPARQPDAIETDRVSSDAYDTAAFAAGRTIAASRKDRDAILFSQKEPYQAVLDRLAAEKRIADAMAALDAIDLAPPSATVRSGSRIALWEGHARASLIEETARQGPDKVARSAKADLLVHGEILYVRGYFRIRVKAYLAAARIDIYEEEWFASPEELETIAAEAAEGIARVAPGRPYCAVEIDTSPLPSAIKVSGDSEISGTTVFLFDAAERRFVVSAPGFHDGTFMVKPELGRRVSISASLDAIDLGRVPVDAGTGAYALYLDSAYMGETPLEVTVSPMDRQGILDLGEGRRMGFILPAYRSDRLSLDPSEALGPPSRTVAETKDGFYDALSYAVYSLPVTILSYGISQTYQNSLDSIETVNSSYATLSASRNGWQIAFWASSALTGALVANAIVAFVDYIKAAK